LRPKPITGGRHWAVLSTWISLCSFSAGAHAPQIASALPPPVHLTSAEDHQRLLDLLHITALRRGPDGDPKSPNAANFDESKVAPYPSLPDPLVLKNGKKVASAQVWWWQRRQQIVEDFDSEIYGRVPKDVPAVHWEATSTTREDVAGEPVVTKKLLGHVDNSTYPLLTVDIQLTLSVPANATGPVPVMMEFGVSPEVLAAMRKRFSEAQWAAFTGNWPTFLTFASRCMKGPSTAPSSPANGKE
jgi:hypothetical protein